MDDASPQASSNADAHGGAGLHTAFRGPFADGPPPEALVVDAPPLDRFGLGELQRMLVVVAVLTVSIVRGLLRKVRHPKSGSVLFCAATGMVDGFFILGPTFVKLGQIVASSPGLFPEDLSTPAQKCLQEVPPFPSAIVHRMIKEDLGKTTSQIFASFDDTPLSAASVGQVHACVLPDGREAVVKLQRPDIADRMNLDLRISFQLAKVLNKTDIGRRANVKGQVSDLHRLTNQELNTPLEAFRQDLFRSEIHHFGDNELVYAPEVYWEYCGPRMICMERLRGVPMDDFAALDRMGFDARSNLRRGMKTWLEALCVHGPFHGDLHAGNIWALEDGRNCFLDFGIMGELDAEWRQMMRDILFTFMIDHDFRRIIDGYKRLGVIGGDVGDADELASLMQAAFAPMMASKMEDLSFGEMFQQSLDMAEQMGDISAPEELTLFGKQFLYFERYVKGIAPDYMLVDDPYLLKNIFPEEAAEKMALLQAADPSALIDPDNPPDASLTSASRQQTTDDRSVGPVALAGPVLPTVDYDGPTHRFLSDEWFVGVEALREQLPDVPPAVRDIVVNATVTGGPMGDIAVQIRGGLVSRDHAPGAATEITLPYAVAESLVVSMDPGPAMAAVMSGKVSVAGDMSRLLAMQGQLMQPTDEQLRFAALLRAMTS